MYLLFYIIFCIPVLLLMPTRVINRHNFPKSKKQGFVVCANHLSNFDVVLFDIYFARKIYYLSKIELFKNRFVGWIIRGLGGIKIDRSINDVGAYKNAIKILKNNKPLGVFPEGTRNKGDENGNMQDAKSGAIVFASKTGTPIIPMAIYRRPKLFRSNKILVGEPFYPEGVNPNKLTKEEIETNTQKLVEIINNLHAQLVDKYSKKSRKKSNAILTK